MNETKNKYDLFRHHAWGGGILLSIIFALRTIDFIPNIIFTPLVILLIMYIVIALFFTYKYRKVLVVDSKKIKSPKYEELLDDKEKKGHEKNAYKLEKKRIKANYKTQKNK